MQLNRRRFFEVLGAGAAAVASSPSAQGSESPGQAIDTMGMLVDVTECIGCRKCEFACNETHQLTEKSLAEFEDKSVYLDQRRMTEDAFTVVNRYDNPSDAEKPYHVKVQCMHCLHPACASACLVGALHLNAQGAVVYDAHKCMGCRYCMVACPFQVPTYEYSTPLTPRVMKCNFCADRLEEGKIPACAEMCPPMALTFGKRSELLALAHQKINANPERYIDHVYGEHEVGGTAWLYIAGKDFDELGLIDLKEEAPPALSEAIQHGIFKMGLPPLLLYGLLGAAMKTLREREDHSADSAVSG